MATEIGRGFFHGRERDRLPFRFEMQEVENSTPLNTPSSEFVEVIPSFTFKPANCAGHFEVIFPKLEVSKATMLQGVADAFINASAFLGQFQCSLKVVETLTEDTPDISGEDEGYHTGYEDEWY